MLVMVMVGYGLSLIAGTAISSYVQLLAQRFVLGLFMGGIFPIVVGIYVGLFASNVRGRLASLINAIFSSAITVLGLASGALAGDWRTLLWLGGIPPILLSGLALVLIPKTADAQHGETRVSGAPVLALFAAGVRRRTLMLAALMGLNFFGYQAFSGWLTTCAKRPKPMISTRPRKPSVSLTPSTPSIDSAFSGSRRVIASTTSGTSSR